MKHLDCGETAQQTVQAAESGCSGPSGVREGDSARHERRRFLARFATQERFSRREAPRATPSHAKGSERESGGSEALGRRPTSPSGHGPAPLGSRNRWPRCGAKTRGGTPCRAAGAGLGGRCCNHGGMGLGPGRGHRLVFLGTSGLSELLFGGSGLVRRRSEPWRVAVVPLWIAEQLPAEALEDPAYCAHLLRTGEFRWCNGKQAERLHRSWPQFIGFRVALKLLERGRVAWGHFAFRADMARWLRREAEPGADDVRLEPAELLAAMRAAGGPITKRSETEADDATATSDEVQP